jgi:hypothetical protein
MNREHALYSPDDARTPASGLAAEALNGLRSDENTPLDEIRQGEALEAAGLSSSSAGKLAYIESYGCQMNVNDSEVVAGDTASGRLHPGITNDRGAADLVLLNTCSDSG